MRFWPWHQQPPSHEDLDEALRLADRALRDAQDLRCRAEYVGEQVRQTGERNHFAVAVMRAIRGV